MKERAGTEGKKTLLILGMVLDYILGAHIDFLL